MTAPVEFNFRNADESRKFLGKADWIMSFLYRTANLGPTGYAGDSVWVVDQPEVTVISVGLEGEFSFNLLNKGVDILREALKQQSTWVATGEPRFFGYNSPMVQNKWAEVQIPIRKA